MAGSQFLHGVEVLQIDTGSRPITTPSSAVIGLIGSAPFGPLNTPTLISGSQALATQTFGPAGYGFTIPDALEAIFAQCGAQVVVVNVADPSDNTLITNVAAASMTFNSLGRIQLPHIAVSNVALTGPITAPMTFQGTALPLPAGATAPVVKSSDGTKTYALTTDYTFAGNTITQAGDGSMIANQAVLVTYTIAAITAGTDYTVNANTGLISLISGGKIAPGATLNVAYSYLDPTKVTQAAAAGGTDATTGAYTGVQALLAAASVAGVTPRILCAPGFTGIKTGTTANAAIAALSSVADKLRAVIVADGPSAAAGPLTTDAAAISFRNDWGSKRIFLVDPGVIRLNPATGVNDTEPASAYVAGAIANRDATDGFWFSPSNQVLSGVLGTNRPVDFAMGDYSSRANLLNQNDIATIIYKDGYRLWGNRTCSADPQWAFLSVVRTADMINDAILASFLWAVDRNITKTFLSDVVESVNAYLRSLQAQGAIIDGRAWADPERNTAATIAAGQIYIDFDFAPPCPAERITFRSFINNNYLEEVLS
jgi:phage tail sheath protein FI